LPREELQQTARPGAPKQLPLVQMMHRASSIDNNLRAKIKGCLKSTYFLNSPVCGFQGELNYLATSNFLT
jgi:hypothetical protein